MWSVEILYIICGTNDAALTPILYPTPSQAIFKLIPKEEQSKLPEDENTPEKRANKLWAYFEKRDNGTVNNTCKHQVSHIHHAPVIFDVFLPLFARILER